MESQLLTVTSYGREENSAWRQASPPRRFHSTDSLADPYIRDLS